MTTPHRLRAEKAVAAYTRRHKRSLWNAVLGNNAGTVIHPRGDSWVYIRLRGDPNQVVAAYNAGKVATAAAGVEVAVERIALTGKAYYEVVGLASAVFADSDWASTVTEHAAQHQRRDLGEGGFDPLDVYTRALVNLRARAQIPPAMTLYVERGFYFLSGTLREWLGGNSPAFTAPAAGVFSGVRRCDLLYMGTDDALHIVTGATTSDGSLPPYPATPADCIPIVYVYLNSGMTSISELYLKDARVLLTASNAATAPHDILSASHGDTTVSAPNDQDVLTWDDGTSKWIAQAPVVPAGGADEILPAETWNVGLSLTKLGVVVARGAGGSWDDDIVESPMVWWDTVQQKFGMVFTGKDSTTEKIGLAWSDDAITWTKSGSNPILSPTGTPGDPDQGGVTGAFIWQEEGVYHLFYIGCTLGGYEMGTKSLCYAHSTDLTTWSRHGAVISPDGGHAWRAGAIWHPNVVKVNDTYYLFFNAGTAGGVESIGYATSTNLTAWTVQDASCPVLQKGAGGSWESAHVGDPSLYHLNGIWYMAYYGFNGTNAKDGLAFATPAGFPATWAKYGSNPTLSIGAPGSFDAKHAHKPFIFVTPTRHFHYYTAVSDATPEVREIALAVEYAPVGGIDHGTLSGLLDDDHTQYQKESEKGNANGYAELDAGALVPADQLGTGVPDGTKFLRDDRSWQAVAGGAHTILSATHTDTDTTAPNDGDVLTWDDGAGEWKAAAPGAGGAHVIQDEGVNETNRANLNFTGAGVSVSDDAGNNATVVTIPGGGGDVATDTIWDAKGDLAAGTGANTAAKVTVGANRTHLVADSAQSTGVRWANAVLLPLDDFSAVGDGDDFAGTSLDGGWTALQATPLTAVDRSVDGFVILKNTGNTAGTDRGIQRAFVPAGDFSLYCKVNFFSTGKYYQWVQLFIGAATPGDGVGGKRLVNNVVFNSNGVHWKMSLIEAGAETSVKFDHLWGTASTPAILPDTDVSFPIWLRLRRATNDIYAGVSLDGVQFVEHSTTTTIAFTVETMGLAIGEATATRDIRATFDYVITVE